MRRVLQGRHSPALVVSVIALVMAVTGTGYAAATSTSHSSTHAAKKTVRGPRGFRGHRGSSGRRGLQGPSGPAGRTGAAGPAGPAGLAGTPGATGPAGTPSTIGQSGLKTAVKSTGAGTNVTLLTVGSFVIQGNCLDAGGGTVTAVLQLVNNGTATANVQWDSNTTGIDVPAAGTQTVSRTASAIPPANKVIGPGDGDTSFAALSPDGSRVVAEGMVAIGAVVPSGSDCAFSVTTLG